MDKYEIRRLNLARLKREYCGGKQAELARKLGRKASYVSRMLSDPNNPSHRKIGDNMVDDICAAFGLHYSWLDQPPEEADIGDAEPRKGITVSEIIEFNINGQEVAAHKGKRIDTPFIGIWRDYVAFQVLSDAFYPRIRNGEVIILQQDKEPLAGDDIVVTHREGLRSLHMLVSERSDFIQVTPINHPDRPETLRKTEIESYVSILSIITAR